MIEIEIEKATHHHLLGTWLINLVFLLVWSLGRQGENALGWNWPCFSSTCIWKCRARALQLILIPCQKHNIDCNGKTWQGCGGGPPKLSFGTCKSASPHYWLRWRYWGYLLGPVITYFSSAMKAAFLYHFDYALHILYSKRRPCLHGSSRVTCLKPFYIRLEYMHL